MLQSKPRTFFVLDKHSIKLHTTPALALCLWHDFKSSLSLLGFCFCLINRIHINRALQIDTDKHWKKYRRLKLFLNLESKYYLCLWFLYKILLVRILLPILTTTPQKPKITVLFFKDFVLFVSLSVFLPACLPPSLFLMWFVCVFVPHVLVPFRFSGSSIIGTCEWVWDLKLGPQKEQLLTTVNSVQLSMLFFS